MNHAMVAVGVERLAGVAGAQRRCGLLLPTFPLPAISVISTWRCRSAMERNARAGLNGLQPLGIADQNHLGAMPFRFAQHPFQLARADHSGFVDHQYVLGCPCGNSNSNILMV